MCIKIKVKTFIPVLPERILSWKQFKRGLTEEWTNCGMLIPLENSEANGRNK